MLVHMTLVVWTARAAFALWAASFLGPRWLWRAACLVYLAHVGCALHFVHHWSHAAALAETARQTRELMGVESGAVGSAAVGSGAVGSAAGLWLNYLFTALWTWDAFSRRATPRWVHVFLGFMWFNAVVVFPQGPVRWAGLAVFALVFLLTIARLRGAGLEVPRDRPPGHKR